MNHKEGTGKDFEIYLLDSGLVRKDRIRYYVHWVDRFLKFWKLRPDKPFDITVPSFLISLETNPNIATWQAKQAADAILIYSEKFMKQSDEGKRVETKENETTPMPQDLFEIARDQSEVRFVIGSDIHDFRLPSTRRIREDICEHIF